MKMQLEYILSHFCKSEIITFMGENPDKFDKLLLLALSNKQPYSYKAAWILLGCMSDNEPFLYQHTGKIIELLPTIKKLTTPHYMDSLSEGTKHSVLLIISKLTPEEYRAYVGN